MKKLLGLFGAAALVLAANTTVLAHDDEDGVNQVDRYPDADVIHYDHHHRQVAVDDYGNVVGEREVHHDHHYVAPRSDDYGYERSYNSGYQRSHYGYSRYDSRRHRRHYNRISFSLGGW